MHEQPLQNQDENRGFNDEKRGFGKSRNNYDNSDHSDTEASKNTEKAAGDLKRFALT